MVGPGEWRIKWEFSLPALLSGSLSGQWNGQEYYNKWPSPTTLVILTALLSSSVLHHIHPTPQLPQLLKYRTGSLPRDGNSSQLFRSTYCVPCSLFTNLHNSFNPHNSLMKWVRSLPSFYWWGNQDPEKLGNLPKITQPASGRGRIWT